MAALRTFSALPVLEPDEEERGDGHDLPGQGEADGQVVDGDEAGHAQDEQRVARGSSRPGRIPGNGPCSGWSRGRSSTAMKAMTARKRPREAVDQEGNVERPERRSSGPRARRRRTEASTLDREQEDRRGRDEDEVDDRRPASVLRARSGATDGRDGQEPEGDEQSVKRSAFMTILQADAGRRAPRMRSRTPAAARSTSGVSPSPKSRSAGTMPRRIGPSCRRPRGTCRRARGPACGWRSSPASPSSSRGPKTTVPGSPAAATASMKTTLRASPRAMSGR